MGRRLVGIRFNECVGVSGPAVIWLESSPLRRRVIATNLASNGSETEARMDKPASKHFLAFGFF
jgi:hypothetical protein